MPSRSKPLLIAHRGGALETFENSRAAFHHAIAAGSHSIEVDLRATKDHQIAVVNPLVIMHDETLDRTAAAHGLVKQFTSEQLKEFRLQNGEPIPMLEELLAIAAGKIELHLEIKEPELEVPLVRMIQKFNMARSVYIISFDAPVLRAIHAKDPTLRTGFLFEEPERWNEAPEFCEFILPWDKLLDDVMFENLKATGKKIHAWVVNEPEEAGKLIAAGVEGIITDRPAALHQSGLF